MEVNFKCCCGYCPHQSQRFCLSVSLQPAELCDWLCVCVQTPTNKHQEASALSSTSAGSGHCAGDSMSQGDQGEGRGCTEVGGLGEKK